MSMNATTAATIATVQCSAVQCSAVQCSAVQCSAVQYSTVQYNAIQNTSGILHGRAEIRNFSSSVEKYFTSKRSERVKYFSTREEKFRTSMQVAM